MEDSPENPARAISMISLNKRPSYTYHQIHAIIGIITSAMSVYLILMNITNLEKITWLLIANGIMWSLHSILHYFEEIYFGFNPFQDETFVRKTPLNY